MDAAKCQKNLTAFVEFEDRPAGALESGHRTVRVNADHEQVPIPGSLLKISDVPRVKEIETAVGEHDRKASFTPGIRGFSDRVHSI
jgi:hypothetical protein